MASRVERVVGRWLNVKPRRDGGLEGWRDGGGRQVTACGEQSEGTMEGAVEGEAGGRL